MNKIFKDRRDAGEQIAQKLLKYKDKDPVVLALPRGALPVAEPICELLNCPMDVVLCKKIGYPGHEEFAIGAISTRGHCIMNTEALKSYHIPKNYIEEQTEILTKKCKERETEYRQGRPMIDLQNKTAIIVDDGIATGMTMTAAVLDVASQGADQIVIAAPVMPHDTLRKFQNMEDVSEVVTLLTPKNFHAGK
jgi:putative phosphoribosyl transferase